MSEPNLQDIHDFLIEIAKKAGEMIVAANPSTITSGSKKNSSDLVTETDQAVEKMVSTTLKEKYPSYEFLGEETYQPGMHLTSAPTFVVDPIDGTVNFVHGYPYVSISLGFTDNKKPLVGVVYNPFTSNLYSAIHGRGAFLNQTTRLPLKESPEPLNGLSNALVAIEWGSDRTGVNWDVKCRTFQKLGEPKEVGGAMVHSMRSLGSAALNLCAVASGTLDVYWEAGCWAWDVAAGWVILEEAGGLMVNGNPDDWKPAVDARKYLAVRPAPEGQNDIIEELWGMVQGRFEYEH
ncbi:MAG: hypothetical protein M1812_002483 [Candelaria pacifica]|nr:MAG: hypothetical protein M1812_002483 [Candelaria pacifica]